MRTLCFGKDQPQPLRLRVRGKAGLKANFTPFIFRHWMPSIHLHDCRLRDDEPTSYNKIQGQTFFFALRFYGGRRNLVRLLL
jgi:hypothetical protein